MLSQIVHVHSQHTNTHRPNSNQLTKREGRTPRTRHSRFILMLATCNVYRAHRHGSESPYPRSTLGLNPCNHLAWRACGPWRTHKHNTYNHLHVHGQKFDTQDTGPAYIRMRLPLARDPWTPY